jgi:16S rRNA (cytosine967-C5)-methyltransferase
MTPSARAQAAIELLDMIIEAARDGGAAGDTLISRYFASRRYAGSKDRRAVRDLVYAAIRRSGDRPRSGRAAMLGLVEDQPDLAFCFDGSAHGPALIGPDEVASPAALLPAWIVPCLSDLIDAQEQSVLLDRAPLDIRVNRLKGTKEDALSALPQAQPIAGFPDALRLPEGFALEKIEIWASGLVEVQDAGSQMIAAACEARAGMIVIDLCAGAGGKTLALAADMQAQGRLVACDTSRPRLSRLPERAERAGAGNVETLLLNPHQEAQALASLAGLADVVLIDAPCSGTGTWRRNPEARWRLTPERLAALVQEQARILDFAAPLVKQGGRLVFAVCALTQAESKGQVEAFLSRHSGWNIHLVAMEHGRSYGAGRLLSPAHDGTDGFFMAVLVRG